jgi:heterodisulfide reductase subunit A
LWESVEKNPSVEIITSASVIDLCGEYGAYTAVVERGGEVRYLSGISCVVVSNGFEGMNVQGGAHLQIDGCEGIRTGSELEALVKGRGKSGLFDSPPESIAFIQCFGSRDEKEHSNYCSRVCCSYASRMARVFRHYYPDCGITFFYMEFQFTANKDVFRELTEMGVRFVRCRPVRISGGRPVSILYDDPVEGMKKETFDIVVTSEGVHPSPGNGRIAAVCGVGQDENGFLRDSGVERGLFVAGCTKRPMTIAETWRDSIAASDAILSKITLGDSVI